MIVNRVRIDTYSNSTNREWESVEIYTRKGNNTWEVLYNADHACCPFCGQTISNIDDDCTCGNIAHTITTNELINICKQVIQINEEFGADDYGYTKYMICSESKDGDYASEADKKLAKLIGFTAF